MVKWTHCMVTFGGRNAYGYFVLGFYCVWAQGEEMGRKRSVEKELLAPRPCVAGDGWDLAKVIEGKKKRQKRYSEGP